jgi:hypothetical protein
MQQICMEVKNVERAGYLADLVQHREVCCRRALEGIGVEPQGQLPGHHESRLRARLTGGKENDIVAQIAERIA